MKYMTFNSSCSYAGLANLLSFCGIDTEDREIALQMRLPYLFSCEDGCFLSGPMLQGAKWFDLYLNPMGFRLLERRLDRERVCGYLKDIGPAMLGLRVSSESKHAVIYTGQKNGNYQFLNNKRKDSLEPETLSLMESDILDRLDESVIVGRLERTAPRSTDYRPYLEESVLVFRNLREKLAAFCAAAQSANSLRTAMNELFRPILLDGLTMLELLEEREIVDILLAIRSQFLRIVKESRPAVLAGELDMQRFAFALSQYERLIINQMETE